MVFDECVDGEYRIYVGALDAPRGAGFIAAVVVSRLTGDGRPQREAYRDDSLACGYRWESPQAALHYALNRARELIRREPQRLHA